MDTMTRLLTDYEGCYILTDGHGRYLQEYAPKVVWTMEREKAALFSKGAATSFAATWKAKYRPTLEKWY